MPSNSSPAGGENPGFLAGGGAMGEQIRAHDWSTSIGAPQTWPQALKTLVGLMLASTQPMFIIWGPGRLWLHNDAMTPLMGNKHPAALGRHALDAVWAEAREALAPLFAQVFAGQPVQMDDITLQLDRRGRLDEAHFSFSYTPVRGDSGAVDGLFGACTDTTATVEANRLSKLEVERFVQLFDQAPSFMAVLRGPEHRFEYANPGYYRLIGHRDVMGMTVAEALPDAAAQGYVDLLDSVYASGEVYVGRGAKFDMQAIPGGPADERYVDFVYQPIRNAQGDVEGIFVEGVDVTERVITDARVSTLAELADRIRDIDDPDDVAFAAAEILGKALGVSRAGYGTIDVAEETIAIERDWNMPGVASLAGVLHFRDYGSYIEDLKRGTTVVVADAYTDPRTAGGADALKAISAQSFVNMPVTEQGGFVALLYLNHVDARTWSDSELELVREVADRTRTAVERRRAEGALRASEANFRSLTRAMPNQAWTSPADGMLDWFNEQVYAYSGVNPGSLDGIGWTRIVHPDDLPAAGARWANALHTGETYEAEFRLMRADGAWRWHIARAVPIKDADGKVTRWIGTNTDIQAQKEASLTLSELAATLEERVEERSRQLMIAEEALRQSQKMEAVGQLTGGIAHDFNNLMGAISGSLELLEKRLADGRTDGMQRYIASAQEASRRASSLTQRLLAFSRRQTLDPKPIDANRLIAGMEELIRRTAGPNIVVEVVGAGGLWATKIDAPQLENALLNLCINARDAMAPDGGRLTIETANKWLDERAARDRDLPPGQYVSICVTDTGTGMTPEVIARAFDPFFTTKPIGQGTGLGLSMIYGFVRQSNGQVRIYSELGKGTTMCLYLPRHMGEAEQPENAMTAETIDRGDGETVLVIDDEPILRMLVTDVLQENGYRSLEAHDGPSGLRILQSDARIDLLITDVGLPGGMNGRQVADAARKTRPNLKVLFITGYAENAVVGNGHLEPGMEVLTKPFPITTLGNRIRDLIER